MRDQLHYDLLTDYILSSPDKKLGTSQVLDFISEMETNVILEMQKQGNEQAKSTDPYFKETELTGRFLQKAEVQINPTTYEAVVSLQFNDEGAKLFAALTEKNIGKPIAIYIDGMPISAPTVQEKISQGKAQISVSHPSLTSTTPVTATFTSDYAPAKKFWITVTQGSFTLHTDFPVTADSDFNYSFLSKESTPSASTL
ncbi:MAG: Protein translocase subunit SecD [Microgenomates group bacterium GW2011_GWB1_46_7]|nr:MAG: Protein translocase subunit SecD [Microgenomates group bacterium GW2011_GWB1_46_7]